VLLCSLARRGTVVLAVALAAFPSLAAGEWKGRVGAAVVGQDASGNEDAFLTQYNLSDGFVLEDIELAYQGNGLERFTLDAQGFGDAFPSARARLDFRLRGGVQITLDYDRRESFFKLAESDLSLRSDDWQISRWKATVAVDSWKALLASFTLRRYDRDGASHRPLYGLNELYPVTVDFDESMTEGSFRLQTRTLPVLIDFEQAFARYERRNRRSPAGMTALNGIDPDLLIDTSSDYDDTQDVPTTRLNVSYGSDWFEGMASILYSEPELDSAGAGQTRFAVGGGSIGTIEFVDELVGSAQADSLFGAVSLGFRLASSWVLRVTGETRRATTDTTLLGQRLVRAQSPLGSPIELSTPVDENGLYDLDNVGGRARVEFRRPTWSVWVGGLSVRREVSWRQTASDSLFETERTSDGFLVGGSWNPGRWLDLHLEYEDGDFTGAIFRVDPQSVSRTILRLRSHVAKGWRLSAHGRLEEATSPPQLADLDHQARPFGIAATWASSDGSSSAGIDLERLPLETVTGIVLPTGEASTSIYDIDVISATLHGETRAGIVTLRGHATYVDDDGSTWPFNSWNAAARVSLRGPLRFDYGAFLEYWSYDEQLARMDDYDVTRVGLFLSWRFE
jgi:hypothetical protein